MKSVRPYLIFPGTCSQAPNFYADCLDGEIPMLQTYADAPMEFPPEAGDRVFNSQFCAGELVLMASDCMPGQEMQAGTNFALQVAFSMRLNRETRLPLCLARVRC